MSRELVSRELIRVLYPAVIPVPPYSYTYRDALVPGVLMLMPSLITDESVCWMLPSLDRLTPLPS